MISIMEINISSFTMSVYAKMLYYWIHVWFKTKNAHSEQIRSHNQASIIEDG